VGYIDPSRRSQEAAIKYFILGSFASACLLFGFGLLYASTGSLNLAEIAKSFSSMATHSWIVLGGLFTLVGLGFKLSLVPFHSWTADAYDGAPTGITAMMAISMKAMILIFSLRFLSYGMTDLGDKWLPLLLIMAILSMLVGNIMALVQSQIKRMLAYSSIAHSGYMAIALCVIGINDNSSSESVLFYLVGYSLASFASFAVLMWLESEKASHLTLDDLGGLVKTHPWSAITLAICMFSLAGIPPTVGFIGKFFVFSAAVGGGFYGLVIIGAIGSTISLYYYLRLIVFMFMKDKLEISPIFSPSRSFVLGAVIFLAISATMLLGTVLPGAVVEYLQKPAASLSLEN
jgi:NADH-quinone oxidoreductase subunit N